MYLNTASHNVAKQRLESGLVGRVHDRRMKRLRCYVMIAVLDLLALLGSFVVANAIYLHDPFSDHGLALLTAMVPIYFCFAGMNSAYGGMALFRQEKSFNRSLQAVLLAGAAVALIVYLIGVVSDISRAVFLIGWVQGCFWVPTLRLVASRYLLEQLGGTPFSKVVIVDGVGYEPASGEIVLPVSTIGFNPRSNDPHSFHALASAVGNADRVVVVTKPENFGTWAAALKGIAVKGELLLPSNDYLGIVGMGMNHGRPTYIITNGPLTLRERALKRFFDFSIASIALAVLWPLLLVTAIAIKLDSKGPVLFLQKRIGRDNRIFEMRKFRSMYTDRCDANAARLTTKNDSRVTKVGAFIRRTSIDELPQLINVLRGEMSIVGPRPHAMSATAADKLYWDVDTRYRHRHSLKPGITGLAQVRGYRGPTDRTEDLTNRLASDLEYVDRWSIWLDLYLVIRTGTALVGKNAF